MTRKNPNEKLDVLKLNNEEVEVLFEEAFEKKVHSRDGVVRLSSWEAKVEKRDKSEIVVAVSVYTYAGETSRAEFHDKKSGKFLRGADEIEVTSLRDDKQATFKLFDSIDVSSNEYILYYKAKA